MKKTKIFLYHLSVFIVGSIGLVIYVFNRLASPESGAGIGGVIAMPAIVVVYVIAFGVLCVISLTIWLIAASFFKRSK